MSIALILFGLSIGCYSIKELQAHGKLRWINEYKLYSFWGEDSWKRKYKNLPDSAPRNWYYKLIKSKYQERWFTSTWLTVNLTDGYHLTQSLMFIFFSLSLSLATDINFFWIWFSILLIHFTTYRLLRK